MEVRLHAGADFHSGIVSLDSTMIQRIVTAESSSKRSSLHFILAPALVEGSNVVSAASNRSPFTRISFKTTE